MSNRIMLLFLIFECGCSCNEPAVDPRTALSLDTPDPRELTGTTKGERAADSWRPPQGGHEAVPVLVVDKTIRVIENPVGMRMAHMPSIGNEGGSYSSIGGFWISTTEVTQLQWKSVMGSEPWLGKDNVLEGDDVAASHISWDQAIAYCERISDMYSTKYRLPTSAEWEYCCRAGSESRYCFGDSAGWIDEYGWFGAFSDGSSRQEHFPNVTGQKRPNCWGLYDMHGNVWEWCEDNCESSFDSRQTGRVSRGGSWVDTAEFCASNSLACTNRKIHASSQGFRVVCSGPPNLQ